MLMAPLTSRFLLRYYEGNVTKVAAGYDAGKTQDRLRAVKL